MVRVGPPDKGATGGALRLWCALILLLVVTHVALMASERHLAMMGAPMGLTSSPALTGMLASPMTAPEAIREPLPPPRAPLIGDCPAQQAVLPLLFLLLLICFAGRSVLALPGWPPPRW